MTRRLVQGGTRKSRRWVGAILIVGAGLFLWTPRPSVAPKRRSLICRAHGSAFENQNYRWGSELAKVIENYRERTRPPSRILLANRCSR